MFHASNPNELRSKYEVEHLGGDTPDRWPAWMIHERSLRVKIINPEIVSQHKIEVIKESILSTKRVETTDSMINVENDGLIMQYEGWGGALETAASVKTMYRIPIEFEITDSNQASSEISITLTNLRNSDGFSGYTKSVTANDHIIRSDITIYAIDSLTDEQLETITRHEFGHALGLGHSSSPNDLMHDTVMTPSFVAGCDIEEIRHVYNAERNIAFKCEIFN